MTGPIPAELGNLTNLAHLFLYSNQLTGTVPAELGNLTNLTQLRIGSNLLTGTLPQSLVNLSMLTGFHFQGTSLCESADPAFQAWIQGLTDLQSSGCIDVATEEAAELPYDFALNAAFPNPFNPSTRIHYALPYKVAVRLAVYDVRGLLVSTLVDAQQAAGHHEVSFEASRLPGGVYFYRLEAGLFQQVRTMVLLK